jgi:hypothetical protein
VSWCFDEAARIGNLNKSEDNFKVSEVLQFKKICYLQFQRLSKVLKTLFALIMPNFTPHEGRVIISASGCKRTQYEISSTLSVINHVPILLSQSQCPRGLRRRSAASRLLRL